MYIKLKRDIYLMNSEPLLAGTIHRASETTVKGIIQIHWLNRDVVIYPVEWELCNSNSNAEHMEFIDW